MQPGAAQLLDDLKAALAERFTIERPIGRGGMATVYLAREHQPPRQVAIKVLDPALTYEVGRERFLREVEIASRLTHPHIVPIFGAGEAGEFLYYTMPYLANQSLRARLMKEGRLGVHDALHVVHDVADALAYAHSLDIVHRDIKPENILLAGDHALVSDFGTARALCASCDSGLTIAGMPIGTPGYMSPEQAGGGTVDLRSDVYALGCVLYEMLHGERPFPGVTIEAVIQAQRKQVPVAHGPGDTVPDGVHEALVRALAWDPDDRFTDAADFAAALAAASSRVPHSAPRATPARQAIAEKSVAVLPFANLSADPDNEYFSDGITEEIIARLSKLKDVKVTSRTSALRFKHTDRSLPEIGRALGVAHVLEGSVRRQGRRVRITAQLIEVDSDTHLWAETYDRDLTDLFEIQSDVAQRIARELETTITPAEQRATRLKPTDDLEAYQLYLRGNYLWNKFTTDAGRRAIDAYEEAVRRDPRFAAAYAGLANAYFTLTVGTTAQLDPVEGFRRMREYAERALAVDDTLADAHALVGAVHTWCSWDWAKANDAFQRALSLGSGSEGTHIMYSFYLAAMGEHDTAVREAGRALELDPVSPITITNVGLQHFWARRMDRAIAATTKALDLDPQFPPALSLLGWAALFTSAPDHAPDAFESAIRATGRVSPYVAGLGYALGQLGRHDEALAIVRELEERGGKEYISPRDIALVHTGLGDVDAAFAGLERAIAGHAAWASFIPVDPVWEPLRPDERFAGLVAPLGLPQG